MQRIPAGGHELRVDAAESGQPAFLCLHGLVDTLEIWDRLDPALRKRGRPVRFDQRGHGESGSPATPARREDLAADAASVLDHLQIPRAIWVGHSMGGIVSLAAALACPERVEGLVLIGTASRCSEKVAGWYERIARAGEENGLDGLARAIYGEKSKRRVQGDAQAIAHVTRMLKSLFEDPLTSKLGAITCPVLLLVGEKDPMGPKASEQIAEQLPHSTFQVVPEHGHWLHVEAPETVIEAYDHWAQGSRT